VVELDGRHILLVAFNEYREEAQVTVKPIPDGYSSVTPYLIVSGAARALDYYKMAFGASELMRFDGPGGKIAHAEMQIGDSRVMLADESPEMGHKSPQSLGGSGTGLMLYVDDVDQTFERAVTGGGTVMKPVENQFYGDRSGSLTDPFGHVWTIATHVEEVAPEETQRRMEAASRAQTT
jgi:PhnB protein